MVAGWRTSPTTPGSLRFQVRPFPDVNNGHWQVSTAGGIQPLWARNGEELFYLAPNGALMSVRIEPGLTWKAAAPTTVLKGQYFLEAPSLQEPLF